MKNIRDYSAISLDDAKKLRGSMYSIEVRHGKYLDWLLDGLEKRLARQYMKTGDLVFVFSGAGLVERIESMHPQTQKRWAKRFGWKLPKLTDGRLSSRWFISFTGDKICIGLTINQGELIDSDLECRALHRASGSLIQVDFGEQAIFYTSTMPA